MWNEPSAPVSVVLATLPCESVAMTVALETGWPAAFATLPLIVGEPMPPATVGGRDTAPAARFADGKTLKSSVASSESPSPPLTVSGTSTASIVCAGSHHGWFGSVKRAGY